MTFNTDIPLSGKERPERRHLPELPCRRCGKTGSVTLAFWESDFGAFTDEHFRCGACGKDWWIDGNDS